MLWTLGVQKEIGQPGFTVMYIKWGHEWTEDVIIVTDETKDKPMYSQSMCSFMRDPNHDVVGKSTTEM
jgi:hypothetical protein